MLLSLAFGWVPDQESTIWKNHWTQAPHWGDTYDHRASSSLPENQSFAGITINEDFLVGDMSTVGWTLTEDDKKRFQTGWNGNWVIDTNNYRDDADAHAFNPNTAPWNQMPDGATFQCVRKIRVVGCTSAELSGPWFASHDLLFKLIINQQSGAREVFVKKVAYKDPVILASNIDLAFNMLRFSREPILRRTRKCGQDYFAS